MERLGLWGTATQFADFDTFKSEMVRHVSHKFRGKKKSGKVAAKWARD